MIRRNVLATAVLVVTALTTSCSLAGGSDSGKGGGRQVTLVTHDSFVVSKETLDEFQRTSGIALTVLKSGDAGALTNKLVLTKGSPIGDVAYGVDSNLASRALGENVFTAYRSQEGGRGPQRYALDNTDRLTAVDVGDVCVNVDDGWFAQHGLPAPTSFADLGDPRYRDLLVVEDPSTSSPGLAFLLATVAKFGEQGWPEYWAGLKANGVKVDNGWETAYSQDFSGSAGKGPRPVVLSYASSPAAEIGRDGTPRTHALLDTCYRQVEYTGVLTGAKNTADAKKVVDFLLGAKVQSEVADKMYVYPAREGVALPEAWRKAAPLPATAVTLSADAVQAGRERWVRQWRTLVQG